MTALQSVCIVGAGGLGCPAALTLLHAGIEQITLIDPDVVELSNLHRQLFHTDADLGRLKVESAAQKIARQFPRVQVEARHERATALNAEPLFTRHQVVIDATDHVETKFMLSDIAVRTGTPLIYGGVLRFEGLAMRVERGGPCLRCVFETMPSDGPSCAEAGVMGSMPALIGALQAQLALRPNASRGHAALHRFDGRTMTSRVRLWRQRPDCPTCGEQQR